MKKLSSEELKTIITNFITESVANSSSNLYRTPLIGFASANDSIFLQLKDVISAEHLLPIDLLPEARTVLAFFLPYVKELPDSNRKGDFASRKWAEAYDSTNKLINDICCNLANLLNAYCVKAAWLKPTYEFDKQKLYAQWSHKHIAYACGLGSFGRNQLLITSSGCAGRFGTLVIDAIIKPTSRLSPVRSCFAEKGCIYCFENCPVQAVNQTGFDRHKCYRHCLANDRLFPDLNSVEVCGKCSTGPCGYIS